MASRPRKAKNNLAVKLYIESLENQSASLVDSQLAMTSPWPKGLLSPLPKLRLDSLGYRGSGSIVNKSTKIMPKACTFAAKASHCKEGFFDMEQVVK